jgi:hypothetical protein
VPQKQRREAVVSLETTSRGKQQGRSRVRSSELARPMAIYAEVIGEVAA